MTRPAALVCLMLLAFVPAGTAGEGAKEILKASGVEAGLCVELGVGGGEFAVGIVKGGRFIYHGLAADAAAAEKARRFIASKGLYGRAAVEKGSLKRLPYADGLVNLVVVRAAAKDVSADEVARVLAPGGAACFEGAAPAVKGLEPLKKAGGWSLFAKTAPEGVDEWTHYNHSPGGNRVSRDTVGPPRHVQWIAGIEWQAASYRTAGMATAGGRMFYSYNEHPGRKKSWNFLTARDAYSGVLLWKRPVSGFVPLTMIATGKLLYGVFDAETGFVALDAASGEQVREFKLSPQWAVLSDGKLVLSASNLKCLDAESGKVLWESKRTVSRVRSAPSVAIDGDKLFFVDRPRRSEKCTLGCIDMASGKELWAKDLAGQFPKLKAGGGLSAYTKGVLIVGEAGRGHAAEAIHAFSTADGKHLWTHRYQILGVTGGRRKAASYLNGFFVGGLYWAHVGTEKGAGLRWEGLDPATGKVSKSYDYAKGIRVA
ncbi:MAG: outer membrane protein assembly factor BamB family protein, partial [Planctomycetota bacterium]